MTTYGAVAAGAVLAGKYRVERVIGQGGMGIVVQATHLQLHQPVAMKFLLPEVLGNQQVVQRFLREAQAAVRLRSEHVARVIDVGTLETGAPYMVLEYLEGTDLASFPRSQLTIGGIVDLVLQACEALAEAHALGIVHRDIKPANFFITRGPGGAPLLKVLDFGISKSPATSSQLTGTQVVMGTPAYMSPEQMRSSRDVDHRSDVWSLGVVLYELLQGVPPFGGDTFSSMVLKVVNDPLPRMTVRLPGELDGVVYRCLEKDPARRFPSVADLAQALAPYAQSETQAALSVQRTRGMAGPEPGRPGHASAASGDRALPSTLSGAAGARTTHHGGNRRPVLAAAGVLVAVVVIAIVASSGGTKSPRSRPGGTPAPAAGSESGVTMPVSVPAAGPPTGTTPSSPPAPGAPPAQAAPPPAAPPQAAAVAPATTGSASLDPPAVQSSGSAAPPAVPPPAATMAGSASLDPRTDATDHAAPGKRSKKSKPPSTARPRPPRPPPPDDDVLGTRK